MSDRKGVDPVGEETGRKLEKQKEGKLLSGYSVFEKNLLSIKVDIELAKLYDVFALFFMLSKHFHMNGLGIPRFEGQLIIFKEDIFSGSLPSKSAPCSLSANPLCFPRHRLSLK